MPFLRRNSTHRRVEALIKQGVGVSEASWDLPESGDAHANRALADSIALWARQVMGAMRRPYGIDHIALALACRDASGRVLTTSSLGVIRPASFYGEAGSAGIEGFLADIEHVRADGAASIGAALLSLGDLAFELDLARAA
jgi:hypothetical protein